MPLYKTNCAFLAIMAQIQNAPEHYHPNNIRYAMVKYFCQTIRHWEVRYKIIEKFSLLLSFLNTQLNKQN